MTHHRGARRRAVAVLAALPLLLTACNGGSSGPAGAATEALIVVSAPLTAQPWVGQFVERGARLAVDELNAQTGKAKGGRHFSLAVLDNGGSPQQAVANARTAVARGAVALITDGVGALAVAAVTDPAPLPVFMVFEGGASLVDPAKHPTLFRLAPANRYLSTRLGDYLSERLGAAKPLAGLIRDTSSYGEEGAASTRKAFLRNDITLAVDATITETASDVAPQVLAARRAGARALVVWAGASGVAAVVRAARSAGWTVPVYSGPAGEDPLVRQRLADHPEWVDGLTFVSFRITSETGPAPFRRYRDAYVKRFGDDQVGVSASGSRVVQPPDWSTYSYDAVRLVAAALATAQGRSGAPLMAALNITVITGANGDERGFGPTDREGVSPDDMYFAVFDKMRFRPVTDDLLSENLPTVEQ